jgi:hypothetical protein
VAYLRPGFFIRRIANPLARLFGAATTLAVRRRNTGDWQTIPVTDPDVRARIIGAYLDRWGRQVKAQFEQLPDPADHPVFRIESA